MVSTAVRTRETWQLVSAELSTPPSLTLDPKIYNASLHGLLDVVRELPDDAATVILVGHNPGVSELVAELTGEQVEMPTAALAIIELPGPWADARAGSARLVTAGRPPSSPH